MERVAYDKKFQIKKLALLALLGVPALVILAAAVPRLAASGNRSLLLMTLVALVIAITSSRHPVSIPGSYTWVSLSEALTFIAVMMLGPHHAAVLAALDTFLVSRRLKCKPSYYAFNVSNMTISVFLSGLAYKALDAYLRTQLDSLGNDRVLVTLAAPLAALALTHYAIHLGFLAIWVKLWHGATLQSTIKQTLPWEPVTYLAEAAVAGLVTYTAINHGIPTTAMTLVLALPVPILIYYTFKSYQEKLLEQHSHYKELSDINDSILEMLAMAIDAKDQTTHEHIQRVKHFAQRIGQLIDLSEPEIEALKAGALLHDIGKIGVPAYILNKPGKLTEHEFAQMKMHTIIGSDMLSNIKFKFPVVPIVRHHHERWDGKGYPDGLKQDEIPLTARILTLVDNYDALRSDRPYHKAMTRDQAIEYIGQNSGTFFDPALVEVFLSSVDMLEEEAAALASNFSEKKDFKEEGRGAAELQGGLRTFRSARAFRSARPAAGLASAPRVNRAAAALASIAETNQRVADLYDMARTLASSLSLDDTAALLSNRLSKLIPFTTCAISLFDADRSEFEYVYAMGRDAEEFQKRRLPVSAGITGWVIQTQRAMYNTNPALDLTLLGAEAAADYKGVIVFPLLKNNEPLGAIALYSTEIESYTSEHIQLIESLSQPISDSVHNALAFERAHRAALIDIGTGLANARAFASQFEREYARTRRSGGPLSLIVISAEGLDHIALGAGLTSEHLLSSLGNVIKQRLRETDLVARHGSEAIIILLPESGATEIGEVLLRVRSAIDESAPIAGLAITVGSATSPDDGNQLSELLEAANLNRVTCADPLTARNIGSAHVGAPILAGTN